MVRLPDSSLVPLTFRRWIPYDCFAGNAVLPGYVQVWSHRAQSLNHLQLLHCGSYVWWVDEDYAIGSVWLLIILQEHLLRLSQRIVSAVERACSAVQF